MKKWDQFKLDRLEFSWEYFTFFGKVIKPFVYLKRSEKYDFCVTNQITELFFFCTATRLRNQFLNVIFVAQMCTFTFTNNTRVSIIQSRRSDLLLLCRGFCINISFFFLNRFIRLTLTVFSIYFIIIITFQGIFRFV